MFHKSTSLCRFSRQPLQRHYHWTSSPLIFGKLRSVLRDIIKGDDLINPKKILERRYIFFTLLALRYKDLRTEFPNEDKDTLYNRAVEQLETKELDDMRNLVLRKELQAAIQPQVMTTLSAFQKVDDQLSIIGVEDIDTLDWGRLTAILHEEYEKTVNDIEVLNSTNGADERPGFLKRKLDALNILLEFHDSHSSTGREGTDDNGIDCFGVDIAKTTKENMVLIRKYQTINMCRSALIREALGYSIISLQSLIPNAGRGAFLDGTATVGSLVAYLPGEIWTKEHIVTEDPEVIAHFEGEEDCQTTLRFDDNLIDSRISPVTVLSQEGSMNPWALGHMINHPPAGVLPNCQSTMLNYTEQMELGALMRYVPNTYAKFPTWKGRLMDFEPTLMHGMCMVARRDIHNEELVYDYRLQSEQTPAWYSIVEYNDSFDESEQVVFFRNDWQERESNH